MFWWKTISYSSFQKLCRLWLRNFPRFTCTFRVFRLDGRPIFSTQRRLHTPAILALASVVLSDDIKESVFFASRNGNLKDIKNLSSALKEHSFLQHRYGWDVIHVASINNQLDIVKWFLQNGWNVDVVDNYEGDLRMARKLKVNSGTVNRSRRVEFHSGCNPAANFRGFTALHYAALMNNLEMVKLLLKHGANPTLENDKGFLPSDYTNSAKVKEVLDSAAEKFREIEAKREQEERVRFPLEQRIKQKIIGQENAINTVAAAIRRKQNGWVDDDHPLVFLFLGSSGIGKTELAKQVAAYLHKDSKKGFIRMDMSEYQQKHEASKFIGAPPSYVGYDEGGQLTNKLKECPNAVVLFDEVEKAHPDVLTTLLQLFDEGRLTDGRGNTIECKDAIFIMTSNVASQEIAEHAQDLRASAKKGDDEDIKFSRDFKQNVIRPFLLRNFLRNEFLGRINEFVYFLPFSDGELSKLVVRELEMWKVKAAKNHKIDLTWDRSVVDVLIGGYDIYYGARSIKYEVDRRVINQIALAQERGYIPSDSSIHLAATGKGSRTLLEASKSEEPPEICIKLRTKSGLQSIGPYKTGWIK